MDTSIGDITRKLLRGDIGERRNLAAAHPDVVSGLRAAFDVWKADVTRSHPLLTNCASR
jgi:hypothetical protein